MMSRHAHENEIIVIGLSMHTFEMARKSDVQHAIIMAAIVMALGSGTFFFIFVIQNYYLVEKTLRSTEDYARKVVASMASGLIGIDAEGHMVTCSRPAGRSESRRRWSPGMAGCAGCRRCTDRSGTA